MSLEELAQVCKSGVFPSTDNRHVCLLTCIFEKKIGKSTLALSFFRFVEATHGSIVIDDIDIKSIGTEDLRGNLTIIPQGKKEGKIVTVLYNKSITN